MEKKCDNSWIPCSKFICVAIRVEQKSFFFHSRKQRLTYVFLWKKIPKQQAKCYNCREKSTFQYETCLLQASDLLVCLSRCSFIPHGNVSPQICFFFYIDRCLVFFSSQLFKVRARQGHTSIRLIYRNNLQFWYITKARQYWIISVMKKKFSKCQEFNRALTECSWEFNNASDLLNLIICLLLAKFQLSAENPVNMECTFKT